MPVARRRAERTGGPAPRTTSRRGHPVVEAVDRSDASLIVGVFRSDPAARAALVERYAADVHGLALRVCGRAHADAVTRDVFVSFFREPARFDPETSLRTYLLAEAHRAAVTVARVHGTGVGERRGAAPDDRRSVVLTITLLPPREGEAVALAYFGAYTAREIAAMLATSERVIRERIREGLAMLRTEVRPS